jgi:branched-subunit amino acid transport protein
MDPTVVLLTIIGMGVVTYLPRLLPLLLLTRQQRAPQRADGSDGALPPLLEAWLRHVPAAVLAAMLFPSLFIIEGRANLSPDDLLSTDDLLSADSLYLWAAIPTLWIAWKTRSLFGAVLAGMAVVALGRLILS